MRHVVIAWAENCAGPGWANTPIWYIERDAGGKLCQGCLQPDEQTPAMRELFAVNALLSGQMTKRVSECLKAIGEELSPARDKAQKSKEDVIVRIGERAGAVGDPSSWKISLADVSEIIWEEEE